MRPTPTAEDEEQAELERLNADASSLVGVLEDLNSRLDAVPGRLDTAKAKLAGYEAALAAVPDDVHPGHRRQARIEIARALEEIELIELEDASLREQITSTLATLEQLRTRGPAATVRGAVPSTPTVARAAKSAPVPPSAQPPKPTRRRTRS